MYALLSLLFILMLSLDTQDELFQLGEVFFRVALDQLGYEITVGVHISTSFLH